MDKQEAIKILKEFHDTSALFSVRTALETVFPELKESEDERIRKELIQYIKNWKANIQGKASPYLWSSDKEECNKLLAWLEKQGKQKSADEVLKIRQEVYQSGYNDGYKHGIEDVKQGEKNTNNQPDVELSKDKVTIKKGENAQDLIEKYVSDHAANRWLDASELEKLLNDFVLEYDKIKNREYEQQCKCKSE